MGVLEEERQLEQLEGTVEDIIFENSDSGYTVFEVSGGGVVTAWWENCMLERP